MLSFSNGLVAGAFGAFSVYPIDVIKTRMQNQTADKILYKNGFDCFRKLGLRDLYRGCLIQTFMVGPEKALKLFTYTTITKNNYNDLRYHIAGGLSAGTMQVVITSPYEMIKTNLQMKQRLNYSKLFSRKMYIGVGACLLRDVPFSGIYFPLYWSLKQQDINVFLAGTLAGAPAAFLCTPADVVKTRIQTIRHNNYNVPKLTEMIYSIYKNEGSKAFFKGAGWRVFRSSPQFGVTLYTFEYLEKYLRI
jgi:solute carrier family 25 aspartate/glutamate transporter 12/13